MKPLIFAAALTPSFAVAHPDHSHEPLSLWHVLTEPDHAAMIAIGIAIVATLAVKSRAARRRAVRKTVDKK